MCFVYCSYKIEPAIFDYNKRLIPLSGGHFSNKNRRHITVFHQTSLLLLLNLLLDDSVISGIAEMKNNDVTNVMKYRQSSISVARLLQDEM
jgi:hypothetical protein